MSFSIVVFDPDLDFQVKERLYRNASDIEEAKAKRKEEIEEDTLKNELKECTFTPNIKYRVPSTKVKTLKFEIENGHRILLQSLDWDDTLKLDKPLDE